MTPPLKDSSAKRRVDWRHRNKERAQKNTTTFTEAGHIWFLFAVAMGDSDVVGGAVLVHCHRDYLQDHSASDKEVGGGVLRL